MVSSRKTMRRKMKHLFLRMRISRRTVTTNIIAIMNSRMQKHGPATSVYSPIIFFFVFISLFSFGTVNDLRAGEIRPVDIPGRDVVEIPVLTTEGRMIVSLEIAGAGRQYFILDTAAGGCAISPRLRKQLKINPEQVFQDTVKGATGMRLMEKVILPALEFGSKSFSDIEAVIFESEIFRTYKGRRVEGILGVDILRHFDLKFDLSDNLLYLYPLDETTENRNKKTGIPFESRAQAGFVEFEISLNGIPIQAILDSGAKSNVINWKAADLLGIDKRDSGVRKRRKDSKGIDGKGGIATFQYTFDTLALGEARLTDAEVKIVDYPVFDMLGIGDGPAMLVGLELFKHCPVEISYSTRQLYLCE